VALLVAAFGDDGGDSSLAQQGPVRPTGVGLVGQQRIGAGPGPTRTATGDPQIAQKHGEHGTVTALTRTGFNDQRPAVAIDQGVQFGRQAPTGPADCMIIRLNGLSLVVRGVPLCDSGAPQRPPGSCSGRADGPG